MAIGRPKRPPVIRGGEVRRAVAPAIPSVVVYVVLGLLAYKWGVVMQAAFVLTGVVTGAMNAYRVHKESKPSHRRGTGSSAGPRVR